MLPIFHGVNNENPYKHLDEFEEMCSTVKMAQFSDEALHLKLFPFSLKDRAKHWLNTLPAGTVTTWDRMKMEFLKQYFPISRTNTIRKAITSFGQLVGEQFHQSWERLKELIRICLHHQVPKWQLVQSFYDGLVEEVQQMVDSSCGGTFMMKSEDEV